MGAVTEKLTVPDVPPPGAGLLTVRVSVCPAESSAAGTVACSVVELVYEVWSTVPFRATVDAEINPLPVTVMVCAADPAVMDCCEDSLIAVADFPEDVAWGPVRPRYFLSGLA